MALPVIHSLWIGGHLSPIEQLTVASYIRNGHTFHLWTYEEVNNIPPGAIVKDASDVIPEKNIFRYPNPGNFGLGKNSYAGFSDMFRYRLLNLHGGCWTDMDVTCLQPLVIDQPYLFRRHHKVPAVGNILYSQANEKLMAWCFEELEKRLDKNLTDWMLPLTVLNEGIKKFDLSRFITDISNRDSFPVLLKCLHGDPGIPESWKVIHWMNEEFRRAGIPKDKFIKGSTIQKLMDHYQIPHDILSGKDEFLYRLKTSLTYYIAINLRYWKSWFQAT